MTTPIIRFMVANGAAAAGNVYGGAVSPKDIKPVIIRPSVMRFEFHPMRLLGLDVFVHRSGQYVFVEYDIERGYYDTEAAAKSEAVRRAKESTDAMVAHCGAMAQAYTDAARAMKE